MLFVTRLLALVKKWLFSLLVAICSGLPTVPRVALSGAGKTVTAPALR